MIYFTFIVAVQDRKQCTGKFLPKQAFVNPIMYERVYHVTTGRNRVKERSWQAHFGQASSPISAGPFRY